MILVARNGITEELGKRLYFLKYPIPEIPEDFEKILGMDWVLEKFLGLGRVSGTRWALSIDSICSAQKGCCFGDIDGNLVPGVIAVHCPGV